MEDQLTHEKYAEMKSAIRSGKIVHHNGRTAADEDGLAFIAKVEGFDPNGEKTKPAKDEAAKAKPAGGNSVKEKAKKAAEETIKEAEKELAEAKDEAAKAAAQAKIEAATKALEELG